MNTGDRIELFRRVGSRLRDDVTRDRIAPLMHDAQEANPWFTPDNIRSSLIAICDEMLDTEKLSAWLAPYHKPKSFRQQNVGIIMAGNIPLVGFFDLLCVVLCGHRSLVKTSSKDDLLIRYVIDTLKAEDPAIAIEWMAEQPVDAVIATGSDNTNRYFRAKYGTIPALLRASRTSIAVLDGTESDKQLVALWDDLFLYYGMGCRNVSRLFVPHGFDVQRMASVLQCKTIEHPMFLNNYRQARAINRMHRRDFTDAGYFILREGDEPSKNISEIIYTEASLTEVEKWIHDNDQNIQCIVSTVLQHPRRTQPGQAQQPALNDYPDGVDVIDFLLHL